MKTKLLATLLFITLLGIPDASADEGNPVMWGVKASVDMELPGKWHGENMKVDMYRPGVGFTLGAVSNIYLGKNFYFEPGISLAYSQYRYKDMIFMGAGGGSEEIDPKLYKWGIQVPLMVGYEFNFTDRFVMNLFTGPQLRYAFDGKIAFKNKTVMEGLGDDFSLWGTNGQRRFDCSWKIGVGFPMNNWVMSVEADFGITDLLKGDLSFRENRLGLGVGYYF